MRKSTQLIDEISGEARCIRELTEELKERYRTMGALLISAKALVPEHRWEAWLQANLDWNAENIETILEADFTESTVPHLPVLLQGNECFLLEAKQANRQNHYPQHPVPKRRGRPPKNNRLK